MKIIPIFIPHAGCPYRCIYCDQHKISGALRTPRVNELKSIIERNLKTIPKDERVEVAFFGGTFTLLPEDLQKKYLDAVYPYVKDKKISGVRMSTHPEAVTEKSMKLFKKRGGCLVELGVQSLDKEVLKKTNRVMDFNTIKIAASAIKKSGLDLGVQVMLGLPGDTLRKSIKTAQKLLELKPETARIYPTLVIKGTALASLFKKGKYKPLSMKQAIEWSARLCDIFEKSGVKVIRIGLHPSKYLNSKGIVLAGPYHQRFGQMARCAQAWGKSIAVIDPRIPSKAKIRLKQMGYYVRKVPLHPKLAGPVKGHPDMMLFPHGKKVIYEPRLEKIAGFLRDNGYECIRGEKIKSYKYPKDIIYDACSIGKSIHSSATETNGGLSIPPKEPRALACVGSIIRYAGKIEKNIENLKAKFIKVKQGYVKCSIIPIDEKHIITSDKGIKDIWGKLALLVRPGSIKLPGYKTGFIGGASGSHKDKIFFTGSLKNHPDGRLMREFIEKRGKKVVELSSGELYDAGTILFFKYFDPSGRRTISTL